MANSNSQVEFTPGSGVNMATHAITEDSVTRHIERFAPGSGTIDMPDTAQLLAVGATAGMYPTSSTIDCTGKARIVLTSVYLDSADEATIRIAFYDAEANLMGYSEEITITNTAIDTGNSTYCGEIIVISNECGASSLKIRLIDTLTTSTMDIWCGVL